jgi:hypothetical protein
MFYDSCQVQHDDNIKTTLSLPALKFFRENGHLLVTWCLGRLAGFSDERSHVCSDRASSVGQLLDAFQQTVNLFFRRIARAACAQ